MTRELLKKYSEKRDFGITAEPPGKEGKRSKQNLRDKARALLRQL